MRDVVFTLFALLQVLLQVLAAVPGGGGDGIVVSARRFVPAVRAAPVPPAALVTELDNVCVEENVTLPGTGKATALVLIDVWDDRADAALYENQNLRVLPLLALARRQGWLVVHAPSENRETPMIRVLPGEILVTGEDGRPNSSSLCFPHLLQNGVRKVLMAGYDTNFCVLDKPCSTIRTSSSAAAAAAAAANSSVDMEVLLVRDATLPQSQWYLNDWYSHMMSVNMIEAAPWLPNEEERFIRSMTVQALVRAAGVPPSSPIYVNATTALKYPFQTAGSSDAKRPAVVPNLRGPGAAAALVVVSCGIDERDVFGNDGFRARSLENRQLYLEPLVHAVRSNSSSRKLHILHVPNGHTIDAESNRACRPVAGEPVFNATDQFDSYLIAHSIETLLYVGYAANRDMLFGVAGMQRYYSNSRYLHQKTPSYYWVKEATVALETAQSLAGGEWAKKQALAYRQPLVTKHGNILALEDVMSVLRVRPVAAPSPSAPPSQRLPPHEIEALRDIYRRNGGEHWQYHAGTDVVGGGARWNVAVSPSNGSLPDPCGEGWFGVECQNGHVAKLFINTRSSGNPMVGELSPLIGQLSELEHFYSSNDKTPSALVGGIPASFGNLTKLKCMYFSHNNLTEPFPTSLGQLTQLQVFLARRNAIPGPLPDFTKMPALRNVWFDGNALEGTLEGLGGLAHLTFLKADENRLTGPVPEALCGLTCDASENSGVSCPLPTRGCCKITACGDKAGVPARPPKTSMGECFPQ